MQFIHYKYQNLKLINKLTQLKIHSLNQFENQLYNFLIKRKHLKHFQQSLNYQTNAMQQGKRQIQSSFKQLQQKLIQTNEPIHQIRLKNQDLQKTSRLFDQKRTKQRLVQIQQQAIAANKKNTALQIKWSQLKQYQECQSLNKAINQQKQAFKSIIAAKDKLINEFWEELKKKDDQYSKTLKNQSKDIKEMVSKMRDQYFALRDQSLIELQEVQKKFQIERKSYIEKAKTEVDECFKKHINMEVSFADDRKKSQEEFERRIEELRIQGMQVYSSLKKKMESDIQNLEKCYEEMKALYQLNTEKLDYNLKVLKEKRQENHSNYEELKKKQRILNTKLRNLRQEYDRADQSFKEQNKNLTAEYKRITRQFKQLQRKFKHFQKADLQRYNEIQAMNEEQVQKYKEKIIKCDIVIHGQQLGIDWPGANQTEDEKANEKENQNILGNQQEQEEQENLCISEEKLAELLDILIEEADFIFDDKMREQLEKACLEEKLKEKMELLKKTLSIDSVPEFNIFIEEMANKCKYVSEKEKHAILQEKLRKQQQARQQEQRAMKKIKRRGQEQKKVQKVQQSPVVQQEQQKVDLRSDFKVDPVLVVDFLVQWMNNRDQRKRMLQKTIKKSIKQLSQRQKKEHIAREGKKYWINMTQVLPERTFRVWKVLDKSFTKYYDLLLGRQKLIDETGDLHTQNEELKSLLSQYIQINHELIIPPTRLMESNS